MVSPSCLHILLKNDGPGRRESMSLLRYSVAFTDHGPKSCSWVFLFSCHLLLSCLPNAQGFPDGLGAVTAHSTAWCWGSEGRGEEMPRHLKRAKVQSGELGDEVDHDHVGILGCK